MAAIVTNIERFVTSRSRSKLLLWAWIGKIITSCKGNVCLDVVTRFLCTYRECKRKKKREKNYRFSHNRFIKLLIR